MSMPVSYSKVPLVLDAVSALKVTNYYGVSAYDDIYCYLRCYFGKDAFHFNITAFEQNPPPESKIGAAFSFGQGDRYIFISTNVLGEITADIYNSDVLVSKVPIEKPEIYCGVDEQGYSWGFETELTITDIEKLFSCNPITDGIFFGNVYKFNDDEAAFGAAFETSQGKGLPNKSGFGEFVVVPY